MNGYILVDKPVGWTSFDVVGKIRNVSGTKKVGHSGTLDPFATGLLIILLGNHTKRQDELMKQDKVYEVTAQLGRTSTTGDTEGEVSVVSTSEPSVDQVNEAISRFIGEITQIPPIYSAIKINGKKAYELARSGKPVEIKSRQITIHSINDIEYQYPILKFTTKVSSGTYIRTLVKDIGDTLKTGAYTTQLRRTSIADFSVIDAISMDGVNKEVIESALKELQ